MFFLVVFHKTTFGQVKLVEDYAVSANYFSFDSSLFDINKHDSVLIYSFIVRNKFYLNTHIRSRFINGDTASVWEIMPDYLLSYNGFTDTLLAPKILVAREKNHNLKFRSLPLYIILDILQCEAIVIGTVKKEFFIQNNLEIDQPINSLVEIKVDEVLYKQFPIEVDDEIVFSNRHNSITGSNEGADSSRIYSFSSTYTASYFGGDKILVFLSRKNSFAAGFYESQNFNFKDLIFNPNIFGASFGTATDRKHLISEPILGNPHFIEDLRAMCDHGEINETLLWNFLK